MSQSAALFEMTKIAGTSSERVRSLPFSGIETNYLFSFVKNELASKNNPACVLIYNFFVKKN